MLLGKGVFDALRHLGDVVVHPVERIAIGKYKIDIRDKSLSSEISWVVRIGIRLGRVGG